MFRKSTGTMPDATDWLKFSLREITGRWVSNEKGLPAVRIYCTNRIDSGYHAELTYNNPQAFFSSPIRNQFGVRYFDLFGHA